MNAMLELCKAIRSRRNFNVQYVMNQGTIRQFISYAGATVRTFFTLRAQFHVMDLFSRCRDAEGDSYILHIHAIHPYLWHQFQNEKVDDVKNGLAESSKVPFSAIKYSLLSLFERATGIWTKRKLLNYFQPKILWHSKC